MTLKVVVTLLYLLFNVAFRVDNKVWVENMHILANMRTKIRIKGSLVISWKFVTIWVVTRGEGGQNKRWQSATRGRGSKISGRSVTYFLNGPLTKARFYYPHQEFEMWVPLLSSSIRYFAGSKYTENWNYKCLWKIVVFIYLLTCMWCPQW